MIVIVEPKDYLSFTNDISLKADYVVHADEELGGFRFVKNRDGNTQFLTNEQFLRFCQPSLKRTALEEEDNDYEDK